MRGFTVLEMLIVLGIIGLMTSVVIAQYRNFDSTTLLNNLAYEIALDVREAQVLTMSVSRNSDQDQDAYGIYFDDDTDSYIIFADDQSLNPTETADGKYTEGVDPKIKTVVLQGGARISDICHAWDSANKKPINCGLTTGTASFKRPHLDTTLRHGGGLENDLYIVVKSARGTNTKVIHINKSSRIEVL